MTDYASYIWPRSNGPKGQHETSVVIFESFFDEGKDEIDDFEFNQDLDSDSEYRSPGWIRYQKRIK